MSSSGFIALSRDLFTHWLWQEERDFSKVEAWIDLIRMATFRDKTAFVQGRMLKLRKGELVASVRYLGTRWRWSKSKVERFLQILQKEAMIGTRNETGLTIISLCKCREYDDRWDSDEPASGTRAGQSRDSGGTNKRREEGKERKSTFPSLNAREARDIDVPSQKQALSSAEQAGVPRDFAEMVWSNWYSRGGKDAAGVVVPWARYVAKRWQQERIEWESGTHRGRKTNGSMHRRTESDRDRDRTGLCSAANISLPRL